MKRFIENMTWKEVNHEIKNGIDAVLVMIGAMEQHGPHLPINTDTLSSYSIAKKIIKKVDNILVAPIIPFGYSSHHMSFKGTITLRERTLAFLLNDIFLSLQKHGFKRIILITTHGGNINPINNNIQTIKQNLTIPINFLLIDEFDKIIDTEARTHLKTNIGNHDIHSCHAGLYETSFMLNEYPNKVRKTKIQQGNIMKYNHQKLLQGGDLKDVSKIGVIGDPLLSSSELGHILENRIANENIKMIKKILNID